MPWPFFLPNALPGDKLKKKGATNKLILTTGGKLTKDPFCCCEPYSPPHCDECPTCDPDRTWTCTVTAEGQLAEIIGEGGPWGMDFDGLGTPITTVCDPLYSVGGSARVEFDYCGKHLRVTIIGSIFCDGGVFFGVMSVMVEQQMAGPVEWCGIGYGGCILGDPGCEDSFTVAIGNCEDVCKTYGLSGDVNILYSADSRELVEEGCGMEPGELLDCFTSGALFASVTLDFSFVEDCPP